MTSIRKVNCLNILVTLATMGGRRHASVVIAGLGNLRLTSNIGEMNLKICKTLYQNVSIFLYLITNFNMKMCVNVGMN